ncbi:MAG TPA: glycosyltransferase family 39 protein [Vicinamibacteria bacterium]|nr:glycosyltransferase family 39 protein [Vicinamibacteria bacterium]
MNVRAAVGALLVLVLFDLALIVVTSDVSVFAALGAPRVGGLGFGLRAGMAAALFVLRFRLLAPAQQRISSGALVLGLLFFPTLVHFQIGGGRINGDGMSYYVFVHSIWKDHDFDLADDYEHFGMLTRGDLAVPTTTGHRRTIYSVGPAVVWGPFFAVGELVGRIDRLLGGTPDLSGFGKYHWNAVALGSVLYGYAALVLIFGLARRYFSETTALAAVLLIYGATFHYWYMVLQPTYAHSASAFLAAVAIVLWDRGRGTSGPSAFLVLGLVLGLAMCVRWQNGVFLVLPGLDLIQRFLRDRTAWPRLALCAALLLAGTLAGATPQMLAWKAIYDHWILPHPPQGPGFVRLHHPRIVETLFSSRHGLLSWTPVFWLGFLGLVPLVRRRPQIGWALVPPLVLMTWVNMGVADYWAGHSFSARRFDSLLPVFALAMAAGIDVLRRFAREHPRTVVAVPALCLAAWNVSLAEALRRNWIPRDDTVAFSTLARATTQAFSDTVGFPTTWPASWLFALRHDRPPSQFDLLVGRYLFHMQNNLGGVLEVGAPGDEALLGEGFFGIENHEGRTTRRLRGRARFFAPLDHAEDLELLFEAAAPEPREIRVLVNGREAGRFRVDATWSEARLQVPEVFWRREINEVALETSGDGVRLDRVTFVRGPGSRRWA